MPSDRYYVVSFNFQSSPITTDSIEEILSECKDWVRLSATTWVVYSSLTAQEIYEKLEPLRTHKQYSFVAEIDIENWHGWASATFIDWFAKPHDDKGGV